MRLGRGSAQHPEKPCWEPRSSSVEETSPNQETRGAGRQRWPLAPFPQEFSTQLELGRFLYVSMRLLGGQVTLQFHAFL